MSNLKISPNLFLEVAELNRLVKFLKKDGYEQLIKSMLKSYGIVSNAENNYFKVTAKTGSSNVIVINPGIAFDSQLRAIRLDDSLELSIDNTGSIYWVVLEYESTNYERGTINITSDGTIQGIGTSFTEVLRGQPNFPTKVRFNSSLNTEEYEVVSVVNDTSAVISGSLIAENNLKYAVIGTFTPGFETTDDNKNIYELDSCKISIVASADVPSLDNNQYLLASIEFSGNGMIITDKRSQYMFNSSFSGGIEVKSDDIVSLLAVKKIQSNLIELSIEHGYSINRFEILQTPQSTVFRINSGSCNFLGSGNIPDSFFKNWILLNKNTMKKVVINDNINKDLYISSFNEDIINDDVSEFIIVPPYSELEYELSYSSDEESGSDLTTSYHLVSQGSNANKILISIPNGTVTIKLRYRLINGEESTHWQKFSISEYVNEEGDKQTLGNSQFIIINEPSVKLRNYS